MVGYSFKHKERTWSAIWLDTDSKLTHQDREDILREVVDCYVEKDKKRNLKGEEYEGMIIARNSFQSLEGFCGRRFDVEIETETRHSKLSGLITEVIDYTLN